MSEMIERVARAIAAAEWDGAPLLAWEFLPEEDTSYGKGKQTCRAQARAAIEAMRRPTNEMARGAQATGMGLVTPEARKEMFTAMIDAALASCDGDPKGRDLGLGAKPASAVTEGQTPLPSLLEGERGCK